MNRTDYQGMQQLFDDGQMIWVENLLNQSKGRVIGFEPGMIEVEVDRHCERWDISNCREMTHGYAIRYDEVLKHPHEFDSHLD
ncbi:hypothetical protein SAMN02745165_02137 [Malonomonas rubra DSM 5091]|uniref:Uncharacterized protein n=1 Tax=Malonomonas rubra DSM 5091 TaxID=1122189 RepID=A0A1M6IK22_MALRU|nr:hypothetical protein [Malonomonas rubra]SHJ34755.1 hypothetical protein SAMN02745165_02137 [Malonomonas rubra DSM 5091]